MSETNQCDCRYLKIFGEDCDKCIIARLKNEIAFLEKDIEQLKASGACNSVYVVVANRKDKDAVVCGAFTKNANAVKNQKEWQKTAEQHHYTIQGIEITDNQYACTTPISSSAKIKHSTQVIQQMSKPDL